MDQIIVSFYQLTVLLSIVHMYVQLVLPNTLLILVINVLVVQLDVNHVLGVLLPVK
jgi:hypothetical protein